MLQPQRTKLLGDLYYDETPRAYIAPPVQEIKALGKAREQDYLLAKSNENELEAALRNLPKDYSPEVYNNVVDKTRQVLSGLSADNYADKSLDVQQFANDFKTKLGAKELIEQAKIVEEGKATIQKAIDKGDIKSDEMKNFYLNKLKSSIKPLSIDPNTKYVSKPAGVDTTYNPFYDAQGETLKQIEGWKSNKNIVTDSKGRMVAGPHLPAYLGYQEGEEVKYDELVSKLSQGLKANPAYMAYVSDVAKARTEKLPPILDANFVKENLLPDANISVEEIQQRMQDGSITQADLRAEAQRRIVDDYTNESVKLAAAKGSFKQIDQKYLADKVLDHNWDVEQKNIDRARADAKARQEGTSAPVDSTSATFATTTGFATTSDSTQASALVTKSKDITDKMTSLYADLNDYNKRKDADPSVVKEKRRAIQDLRISQEYITRAQRAQETDLVNTFNKEGVDMYKVFNESKGEAVKDIITKNQSVLEKSPNTRVDVTSKITHRAGRDYITFNRGGRSKTLPVDTINGLVRTGNSYYFNPSEAEIVKSGKNEYMDITDIKDITFDVNGQPTTKVTTGAKDFVRLPTKAEYTSQIVKDYQERNTGSTFGNSYNVDNVIYPNKVRDVLNDTRHALKDRPLEIHQPLTVINTTGATSKDLDKGMVNLNKALTQDFITSPTNYKVEDAFGVTQEVSTYLKSNFNVDLNPKYIKDQKAYITTNSSPKNGQYYQGMIELTSDGIKEVMRKNPKALANGKYIKVALVNPANSPNITTAVREKVLQSYSKVRDSNNLSAQQKRLNLGAMHANNTSIGKDIDRALVDISVPNQPVPLTVQGYNYDITPVAEAGRGSDIDSQSYTIGRTVNNRRVVLAKDSYGGETWVEPHAAGTEPIRFTSTEDLKSYFGAKFLDAEYQGEVRTAEPATNITRTRSKFQR